MSINRVNVSGNLTRDPDVRATQGGTTVMSFGVAVNDRQKDPQTGEWKDRPNYVDCTMFGRRAEALSSYLAKGTKVAIEGKLRWSSWEKDGQRKSKLEVIVEEIEFMNRAGGGAQAQAQPVQQVPSYQQQPTADSYRQPQPVAAYAQQAAQGFYDEDLDW